MSWFKPKIVHKHDWKTVAFDVGYTTKFSDEGTPRRHHISFQECNCGKRQTTSDDSGYTLSAGERHTALSKARKLWEHAGKLKLSDEADLYDDEFEMTSDPTRSLRLWERNPIKDDVDAQMRVLKKLPSFVEMCKHSGIEEAFGKLEVQIELHRNIEPADESDS